MKVSLNIVKQFIDFELPPVAELVERINEQLGGVEEVIDFGAKYKGIVIAKVVSCVDHPNADKLHVCMIDDGGVATDVERDENGLVQVVCGAPNAREGIFVAWLPPGSIVPASYADESPFVLGKRELRGVVSNGMLASPAELAISDNHDGILEIGDGDLPKPEARSPKPELVPGADFAKTFGLDDIVIDIENKMFTHRPDCFGVLGVAREISAILGCAFKSPSWYELAPSFAEAGGLPITVLNEVPEKVPRFIAVALKDVGIRQSPLWLQCALMVLGSKSISNVVDITNYAMLITGQPMHAYDYDKLRGNTLGVRMGKSGEALPLLNGKTYDVTEDDIVIFDGEGLVGMGGVMGGSNSEVSAQTKNIVLECATFDMYAVRKTSMRHGLFTDAVTRYTKGQSPLQNPVCLSWAMNELISLTGAKQASAVEDKKIEGNSYETKDTWFSAATVNSYLGLKLTTDEIRTILQNVEFTFIDNSEDRLHFKIPYWRTDIERGTQDNSDLVNAIANADIAEEIGRLYGFDKLPRELPNRSIYPAPKNSLMEMKRNIASLLSGAGANEVKTYSFVHEKVISGAGQKADQAFRLGNALSPDLQYYRLSLVPSLLAHVHPNIKAGHNEFGLFEFGKAHNKLEHDEDGLPNEVHALGYVYSAKKPQAGAAYYRALRTMQHLLTSTGVSSLRLEPLEGADLYANPWLEQMVAPFEPARSAVLRATDDTQGDTKGLIWGVIGEFKASVRRAFKLPEYAAGFELDPTFFLYTTGKGYRPLPRFPHVSQDISLKVPGATSYGALFATANTALEPMRSAVLTLDLSPIAIYQPEGAVTKTITFRLRAADYERTLTDTAVVGYIEAIAQAAAKTYQAERV